MIYGYARVSTSSQGATGAGLDAQASAILASFPEADVRAEIASGGKLAQRPELGRLLGELGRGDTLCVAKLDRLARNVADFCGLADRAQREGWRLVLLDLGVDSGTPA